jgi:hypothetical protein
MVLKRHTRTPLSANTGVLFSAVCLCLTLVAASQALSYDCFATSPSFLGGNTAYDALNVRDLTQTEQNMLATLFKSLTGRWEGDGDGVLCGGNVDSPTIENRLFSLQAEGKADYRGSLALRMKVRSISDKTHQIELARFFLVDNKLRFDHEASAGDVEFINLAKDRVKFLQRFRGGPGTVHREVFISLIAAKSTFIIEKTIYTQGQFTFGRVLRFKRW